MKTEHRKRKIVSLLLSLAMLLCLPAFANAEETVPAAEGNTVQAAVQQSDAASEQELAQQPDTAAGQDVGTAITANTGTDAYASLQGTVDDGNGYPIVLVHGLFGYGNAEVANFNYWGGFSSLRSILEAKGYEVYTPTIGPVSSNWDRACELYAYLVGGTVDYGAAHAAKNGHARYGRTFPGVLPELSDPDSTLKVHLVGHSMGGETIRMLAQLLENGDADEISATTDGSISPLFAGNSRHWIESITTICTPHDGSQFDSKVSEIEPLAHQFAGALATATGANIGDTNLGLDFQLDQWGLKRGSGESYEDYFDRVMESSIWTQHVTDLSIYDLSNEGAAVLNDYAKAQSDIYYFSISCCTTYASPFWPHYQRPLLTTNAMLMTSAIYMGKYTNTSASVPITSDWWKNDGIVSVHSAKYPDATLTTEPDAANLSYGTSSSGTMVFKDGTEQGVWNYIEEIPKTDHLNVVYQYMNISMLRGKYFQLAAMLESIPAD